MRNLKRALSLTLASVMLLGMMVVGSSAAAGYSDVDENDNVEAIEVLQAVEVMVGDDRGFGPDRPVTRNEMAVVMGKLLNLNYNYYASTCPFTDVADWARGWVGAAYANGIVSGRGNGIYDGEATVTAVEAASMMMRALGYFQYENDYEGGFQLSTVRKGTDIGIFDGVGTDAASAMTRNQVAQMALNALQSGTVEPDGQTINLTTPDGKVYTGKVNYVFVTSYKDFAYAISDLEATSIGSTNSGSIVELGERLYNGDLELDSDARDDFGRPSREWKYRGNQIGTYMKKELIRKEWTTEVTGKDLYDVITKSTLDDKKYDKNLYIDGEDSTSVKNDEGNTFLFALDSTLRNNKDGVGGTGNGVLTQVFIDPKSGNNNEQKDVTVSIINTYLARARADYSEKKEELDLNVYGIYKISGKDEYIRVDDPRTTKEQKETITVTLDDFDVADVKEKDAFLVTVAAGKIQTMAEPGLVSKATMTAFKQDDYVVVDGTQYDYNEAASWNYEVLDKYTGDTGRENLKDKTYDVYLDNYGYLIGVDIVDEVDNYVFITGVDDDFSNRYARNVKATAIFMDGTIAEITYDSTDSELTVPEMDVAGAGAGHEVAEPSLVNTWCTYSVDKNGIYTLHQVAAAIDKTNGDDVAQYHDTTIADDTIDKKNIDLKGADAASASYSRVYGNDDTVYLNATVKTITVHAPANAHRGIIDDVDSVVTGIDNVSLDVYSRANAMTEADRNGKITASADECDEVAYGAYALYDDDGYVIAAVVVADDGSTSDNWVYVSSGSVTREAYSSADDEWTWSREVILDGVETEIHYKGDSIKHLNDMKKYNWYVVKYKGDGNVKSVTLAVDELAHTANGNGTYDGSGNANFKDDKYEGNIKNLAYTVQNGKDTILYEAANYAGYLNAGISSITKNDTTGKVTSPATYGAFTDEPGTPYLEGRTFYATTTTKAGFRVREDVKVVFIQTNDNKEKFYYEEGVGKLEDLVDDLNKGEGATATDGKYNYEISAVLDSNLARVVIIRDLNGSSATVTPPPAQTGVYSSAIDSTSTITGLADLKLENASVDDATDKLSMNVVASDNISTQIKDAMAKLGYTDVTMSLATGTYTIKGTDPNGMGRTLTYKADQSTGYGNVYYKLTVNNKLVEYVQKGQDSQTTIPAAADTTYKGTGLITADKADMTGNDTYVDYAAATKYVTTASKDVYAKTGYVEVTYGTNDGTEPTGGLAAGKVGKVAGPAYAQVGSDISVTSAITKTTITAATKVTLTNTTGSGDAVITEADKTVSIKDADDAITLTWSLKAGEKDIALKAVVGTP